MKLSSLTLKGALLILALPLLVVAKKEKISHPKKADGPKHYTAIRSMDEYNRIIRTANKPVIIAYNTETCGGCTFMEPGYNKCAKEYAQAEFYCVNLGDKAFKGLQKKAGIKGIPTTHFIKRGKVIKSEQGGMEHRELDGIVHQFIYGKPKSYTQSKQKPIELKKSLEEETD